MPRVSRTRPRVEDPNLAHDIGARLRRARLAAGLTQQQLAGDRYTKAFVSALENGLSRPSMAALDFFSERLGIAPANLLDDAPPGWARLEADVALASGRWNDAVDAYRDLLAGIAAPGPRAELLNGLAEALVRRGNGREATAPAAEAAQIFAAAGRDTEAAMAQYWLSAAQYQQENHEEAKALLHTILARVRLGLRVEPDFELRLVMALSSNESRVGNHDAALAYLEEVRGLAGTLDDRRRALYLFDLAYSYRETGDFEAAVRAGMASLELFRKGNAEREMADLENDLALSYVALGNTSRAIELAGSARRRLEALGDRWLLSHVVDTQARIALAAGDAERALAEAGQAAEMAEAADNRKATIDALLTVSRARSALGRPDEAVEASGRAAELAREVGNPPVLRKALREWAEQLAAAGQHERAYAVMREALAVS
jgi:tetratricopeptide (TPR) repeat protein